MSHKILLGAALVAVAVLGFAWFDVKNQNVIIQTTATSYTLAQVATHNSAASCWATINGKVYNLTNWINQHPGGQSPILSLCGTDGSAAFNGQHGGQGRPASELINFYLGTLTQ